MPSWVAPMIALITPILPLKSYGYIYSNQKQRKMNTCSECGAKLEIVQNGITNLGHHTVDVKVNEDLWLSDLDLWRCPDCDIYGLCL